MAKYDTQTPARVAAADYNAIRNTIIAILGPGSGQKGYGQTVASSAVFPGNTITKAQWDLLRYDLLNVKLHQDGVYPSLVEKSTTDFIGFGASHPNTSYETLASQAELAKFNLSSSQSVVSTKATQSRTGSWTVQSQCTATVTFGSADQARYFFNSGGKVRFSSTRTEGSASAQNNAWTNLLNTTVGTVIFGAIDPTAINFYNLTTSYQTFYNLGASTPYSSNYFRLEALCNCTGPTNVNGTASQVTFRITWRDDHSGPVDSSDGTLAVTLEEIKAAGVMLPSGTFAITSPSYSISGISAS
jgi:hypothetical protein